MLLQTASIAQNGAQELEETYRQYIPLLQDVSMGGFFEDPPRYIQGNPRFLQAMFEPGQVMINGIVYSNVMLSYDIYSDVLITFHPKFAKISLRPGRVSAFTLADGSSFIHKESNPGFSQHNNGYYQLLLDDAVQVLVKHRKVAKQNPARAEYLEKFVTKTNYFIEKDHQIFPANNARQAIRILELERKDIRPQIRKQGLNYRIDPAAYLLFLGKHYSSNISKKPQ